MPTEGTSPTPKSFPGRLFLNSPAICTECKMRTNAPMERAGVRKRQGAISLCALQVWDKSIRTGLENKSDLLAGKRVISRPTLSTHKQISHVLQLSPLSLDMPPGQANATSHFQPYSRSLTQMLRCRDGRVIWSSLPKDICSRTSYLQQPSACSPGSCLQTAEQHNMHHSCTVLHVYPLQRSQQTCATNWRGSRIKHEAPRHK